MIPRRDARRNFASTTATMAAVPHVEELRRVVGEITATAAERQDPDTRMLFGARDA